MFRFHESHHGVVMSLWPVDLRELNFEFQLADPICPLRPAVGVFFSQNTVGHMSFVCGPR